MNGFSVVNNRNKKLLTYYTGEDAAFTPLGRILSANTREYMCCVVEFKEVQNQMK